MKYYRSVAKQFISVVPAAMVFVVLGLGFLGLSSVRLFTELNQTSSPAGPMLAAWGNASLSLVTLYVGYWLTTTEFDSRRRWLIAASSIFGLICAVSVQAYIFVIEIAEGRPITAPIFPIVLVSAVGTLAGSAIGYMQVTVQQEAARAREARDAMAFTNSLLRHDIRNGLQIIRGRGELVELADDARISEAGEAINRQVNTLDELIEEVRAVSDVLLESADVETIDLSSILSDAVETTRDSYPNARVNADIPTPLQARGTNAIVPVLTNLLNNAVQHNPGNAQVEVTADRTGESVTISIEDDGDGVPPNERDRIFERGVTTDGGDGLGLHIVATIVDRLDGDIRVEDSDLGGASFVVELPAADDHF